MPRADQPTSVRFSRETLEALQKAADERRWGVSALVRYISEQWLDWHKKQGKQKKADRNRID